MSDETVETKAGHPPAVKVGGMRVTQRSRSPGGTEHGDPENPQIPPQDKQAGDAQVHGIGGLQSQPKDLLVTGTSGIPVTAKDLGMHLEGVKHTHEKPHYTNDLLTKGGQYANVHASQRHEPRNHGTNHNSNNRLQ